MWDETKSKELIMANRNFSRFQALEKEIKALYAEVAIGATGAPTLTKGLGIASISRKGAGNYKVVLDDKYTRLMFANVIHLDADEQDLEFQLEAEDVNGTSPYVDFFCLTGAVATEVADGSKLYIKIELKNSSAGE